MELDVKIRHLSHINIGFYSIILFLFLSSLGPVIDNTFGSAFKLLMYFSTLLVTAFIGVFYCNVLRSTFGIYTIFFIIIILLAQLIFVTSDLLSFGQGIFRFLLMPIAVFSIVVFLKQKNINSYVFFRFYFILNLAIFYYRAIFDYSFFGFYDGFDAEFFYRPSNLSSPIIFAIELSIWLGIIFQKGKNITLWFLLIVPALILMHSRSSFIIVLLILIFYYFKNLKKINVLLYSIFLLITAVYFIDYEIIESIVNFKSSHYQKRFSSVANVLNLISEFSVGEFLFGLGYGVTIGGNSYANAVYLENGILSIFIENGLFLFLLFIFALFFLFFKYFNRPNVFFVILISVIITNLFASNITSNTVFFFILYLYFFLIESRRKSI